MKLFVAVEIAPVRGGYAVKTTLPDTSEIAHATTDIETVLEIVRRNLLAWDASDKASDAVPTKVNKAP